MRRYRVERRRVIFIGVEGTSDRAFVTFLQNCCDEEGLHLHLNTKPADGGDSVVVVEEAARYLNRHPGRRDISDRLVLLDSDRIRQDKQAGRDAQSMASKEKLKLIFLRPNLEGCCSGYMKDTRVEELETTRRRNFGKYGVSTANN